MLSDILLALDRGDFAALALLDLSAAFNTVDHDTLIRRLHLSYGLLGLALNWFRSYLHGRVQHVRFAATRGAHRVLKCGRTTGGERSELEGWKPRRRLSVSDH